MEVRGLGQVSGCRLLDVWAAANEHLPRRLDFVEATAPWPGAASLYDDVPRGRCFLLHGAGRARSMHWRTSSHPVGFPASFESPLAADLGADRADSDEDRWGFRV